MTTSNDGDSAPPYRPSALRSGSDRARLYGAEVLSGAGDGIFWVALVVTLSDQPRFELLLLLAVLARLGPRALLSMAAGSLIDRSNLPLLLITIDVLRGGLMLVVATLDSAGRPPIELLICVLASYVVGVPTRPALTVALVRITDEAHLASANAMISSLRQIMTFVGPLLGVIVVAWSTTVAFAINGMSFLASAALIASTRGLSRRERSRNRPGRDTIGTQRRGLINSLIGGAAVVGGVPGMTALFGLVGAMYFIRGFEMVIHVLVVRDLIGADPNAIGYLAGAIGLGAVAAMPIAARAASASRPDRVMLIAVMLTAAPTLSLAVIGHLAAAAAVLVPVGIGMVVFEVVSVVTIQRTISGANLGRAFGTLNSVSNTGKLLGAVSAPALVVALGTGGALVASAAALIIAGCATAPAMALIGRQATARRQTLEPITDVLGSLAIFDGATRTTLERLADAVIPCSVTADTVLIREGDQPDDLYLAITGEFTVTIAGVPVNTLGPGDWFGEIGIVHGVPRMATVTTATDGSVWRIPGDTFLDALEESGAAPSALVQGIADRLASASS